MSTTTAEDIKERVAKQLGRLVGFNINHVAHLMAKHVNRELSKTGYTLQMEQLPVLFMIYFSTELMSQQEIANLLQKDKSGIQRTIKTLERDGYLRVQQDDVDRRKNNVQLTPAGRNIVDRVVQSAHTFDQALTNKLTTDEVDTLLAILNKIAGNLEN